MKATPYPWEWIDDMLQGAEFESNGQRRRALIVETDSGHYPPHGADAQLIAAAPKLLEALRQVWPRIVCKHSPCWLRTTENIEALLTKLAHIELERKI
jgi:hypothetical protein